MKKVYSFALCFMLLIFGAKAQIITISTGITTSNWTFISSGNPIGTTFCINNTNTNQIILMEVSYLHNTAYTGSYDLYYSSTSLLGTFTYNSTAWTLIGTSPSISGPTAITKIFSNLNFTIPAGAQYRFLLRTTNSGNTFSTTSLSTPNISSASGVELHTYTTSLFGNYTGFGNSITNGPTNFPGSIGFIPGYPCSGKPSAGIVNGPSFVCPNRLFSISQRNPVFVLNLGYQWQYSNNGTSWSNFVGIGAGTQTISDSIKAPRWYRAIVTCNSSGSKDTTAPWLVSLYPFYYCYCVSGATATTGLDVGNVKVIKVNGSGIPTLVDTMLNFGTPTPLTGNTKANRTYSPYQDSANKVVLYRDSTYNMFVSQITSTSTLPAGKAMVYIDYNRDGEFDTVAERVLNKTITNPQGWDSSQFTVPHTAEIGLTGMRVIIRSNNSPDPCGSYADGETEDYLVDMRYEPCSGVPNAGMTEGDTAVCLGYDYLVTDTTFEKKKSDISSSWQVSADNNSWFNILNSTGKDTLQRVFTGQPLYYRLRVSCDATNDTAYSQPMYVNQKVAYKCYCYSQAVGGKYLDSSDIGSLSLAGYSASDGGTHLDNPKAFRKRTDHTDEKPIALNVDSLYQISSFHIMRGSEHADAKITIFIDFNNNHTYDIPEDRVFTGFTSVGNFTLIDNLSIPPLAIMNVPTGMRVILNNDIGPNIPSDEACGAYTSGETEDYMVMFSKSVPATVNDMGYINNVVLYPNPTSGKFVLQFTNTKAVTEVSVTVTDVTGRTLVEKTYEHNGGQFTKEIDMRGHAKGVYFIEINAGSDKVVRKLVIE